MVHSTKKKQQVIQNIKDGKSYKQTAENHHIHICTVMRWCKKENISSKHKKGKQFNNIDIIKLLEKIKVGDAKTISEQLNRHQSIIYYNIKKLIRKRKIQYSRYNNITYYYLTHNHFREWKKRNLN